MPDLGGSEQHAGGAGSVSPGFIESVFGLGDAVAGGYFGAKTAKIDARNAQNLQSLKAQTEQQKQKARSDLVKFVIIAIMAGTLLAVFAKKNKVI